MRFRFRFTTDLDVMAWLEPDHGYRGLPMNPNLIQAAGIGSFSSSYFCCLYYGHGCRWLKQRPDRPALV